MSTPEPILSRRSRIAVIGAGVSGLSAAWALREAHDVALYEKEDRLGGHSNTVTIDYDGDEIAVDTGFIVFNTLNYPNLTALFEHLNVETFETDMSFGFSLGGGPEWSSNGARGLFADPRNAFRPGFIRMLLDIVRFNREAIEDLEAGRLTGLSLGGYLEQGGYSDRFRDTYLLPMGAAIWSSTESEMTAYPAEAFVRFFKNHKLVKFSGRPKWRTVLGGSQNYVSKLAADMTQAGVAFPGAAAKVRREADVVHVTGADGIERSYDEVILACHSDEALALMEDADEQEEQFLSAVPYAPNIAVLHRDQSLLPEREHARAAWCYVRDAGSEAASVSYDMNRLQGIRADKPLFVTLNPDREPDPALTFARFEYGHPQFSAPGMAVQRVFNRIQGVRRTWFAGAWLGYGFHEDGLRSGLRVALRLGGSIPWTFADGDVDGGPWGARPASALSAMAAAE
jgi:hypothetical protein